MALSLSFARAPPFCPVPLPLGVARRSLSRVSVFPGQSYVALSRATSLDGLQVLRFDPSKVKAHDTVVEWSVRPDPSGLTLFSWNGLTLPFFRDQKTLRVV